MRVPRGIWRRSTCQLTSISKLTCWQWPTYLLRCNAANASSLFPYSGEQAGMWARLDAKVAVRSGLQLQQGPSQPDACSHRACHAFCQLLDAPTSDNDVGLLGNAIGSLVSPNYSCTQLHMNIVQQLQGRLRDLHKDTQAGGDSSGGIKVA